MGSLDPLSFCYYLIVILRQGYLELEYLYKVYNEINYETRKNLFNKQWIKKRNMREITKINTGKK